MKKTPCVITYFCFLVISIPIFLIVPIVGNCVSSSENSLTLTLDRYSATFLFDVPEQKSTNSIYFNWQVESNCSYAKKDAILQFSQNGEGWQNLAQATLELNGSTVQRQMIDDGWAMCEKNYLRVVVNDEFSNVLILDINANIGYPIFLFVLFVTGLIFVVLIHKEKVFHIDEISRIRSAIRKHIQGKELVLIFLFALLIRLLIAPWTEQRFDCYVNRLWGSLSYGYDMFPFEPNMPVGYPLTLRYSFPPVWLFIVLSIFPVWLGISGYSFPGNPTSLWINGIDSGNIFESYRSFVPQALPLLDFFFKLPTILADIGIGYLLYKFAKDSKYEKVVLALWLFNPYTIHISTVWGLFDPLCTFFALCSVYLLWKNRLTLSAVFLSLGLATKMYPMFFLIPIIIYLYKKQGLHKSLKYLIVFLLATLIIFGSFLLFPGGFEFVYRLFFFRASPDMYGKNLFTGMTWTHVFSLFQWEVNIPIFPLIFIPVYFGLNYIFWRGKRCFDSLVSCLVCILFVVYLSYTVVNPQYVFWMLPFLLLLVIKGKFPKKFYWTFSAIPLLFIYSHYNPLQFFSPVIIWDEGNYLPWSDIFNQLRLIIFNSVTINLIVGLFCILLLFSLVRLGKGMNDDTFKG